MIYLYHILSFVFLPLYVLLLVLRVIVGKEDIKRIRERFAIGHTHTKRNETLVWIHAASVGESMIALTLVENINDLWLKRTMPKTALKFLVTSGTKSSAKILQQKLPVNAVHQLIPIDNIIFVKKFFRNWQPTLGIFIESELWPCLISEGKKHCKLLLLNARISDKSFASWKKISSFFRAITSNFSEIIVQSNIDYEKFMQLGMTNINNLGNIKFANKKLPVNEQELTILAQHMSAIINSGGFGARSDGATPISNRRVTSDNVPNFSSIDYKRIIVFASTHLEDETVLLNIIKPIKQRYPNCYFILIPRHPERKNDIGKACTQLNLTYSIKSEQNIPILTDDLYIVDKFGELGLFFSISYISFVGGSFKQGGHNVLEPAYFANYIIFGPDMSNFANIANEMLANKAATQIQNESDLLNKIEYLLSETGIEEAKIYQTNALEFVNKNQQILGNYLAIVEKYLLVGVNN